MSRSILPDLLPVARKALQAFLQTLLGAESPLALQDPEETTPEAVQADCQARLAVLGRTEDATTFVLVLSDEWLPLLSAAMLGEAMSASDEGAEDLVRELTAQGYGSVRNALGGEGIKLPEITYLVSLPGQPVSAKLFPSELIKIPFELTRKEGSIDGFVLIPPPSAPLPEEEDDPTEAAAPAPPRRAAVPVAPAAFPNLGSEHLGGDGGKANFNLLAEVELEITVELGRRHLPLADVLNLTTGSVIELEKLVGEPLQIFANGRLIAEGEAVVIDEQFGVRVTALASTRQRAKAFL